MLTLGTKLSFVRRSFGVPYSSTAHLQYVCSTSALLQVYRWLRSALTGVGDGEYKCLLGLRWSTMSRSMPSYMRDLYHLVETAQTIGRWCPRTNLNAAIWVRSWLLLELEYLKVELELRMVTSGVGALKSIATALQKPLHHPSRLCLRLMPHP